MQVRRSFLEPCLRSSLRTFGSCWRVANVWKLRRGSPATGYRFGRIGLGGCKRCRLGGRSSEWCVDFGGDCQGFDDVADADAASRIATASGAFAAVLGLESRDDDRRRSSRSRYRYPRVVLRKRRGQGAGLLGSVKSNPVVELVLSSAFGGDPYKSQDNVKKASDRTCPSSCDIAIRIPIRQRLSAGLQLSQTEKAINPGFIMSKPMEAGLSLAVHRVGMTRLWFFISIASRWEGSK